MPVTRCICHDITFAELRALSQQLAAPEGSLPSRPIDASHTLEALQARTSCGTGCGTCIPYIKVMLKTGHTSLPVLTPQQIQRILESPLPRAPSA